MPIVETTPTSIEEFRRLSNAFLSGCRFPSGSDVYVVASRSGLREIYGIILVGTSTTEAEVEAAVARGRATHADPYDIVVYRVIVPNVDRLNTYSAIDHGSTGSSSTKARSGSAAPPGGAVLGDVKRIS